MRHCTPWAYTSWAALMSKFDAILIVIALFVIGACAADFWLIVHDYPEFGAGFWSVVLGVSGGEIATFSIYRMVKRSSESKVPKALTAKHALIAACEESETGKDDNGNETA